MGRRAGNFLILVFATGFVLSFIYWEKLLGSFLHGYIFTVLFLLVLFWEKSFAYQGVFQSSRMPWAFREILYIGSNFGGFCFSVFRLFFVFAKIPLVVLFFVSFDSRYLEAKRWELDERYFRWILVRP